MTIEKAIDQLDWYFDADDGGAAEPITREAYDTLKSIAIKRKPSEDWISRERLRNEIQYYIEEAGWGDEANKVLGWCLEFIDNQEAVKWDG